MLNSRADDEDKNDADADGMCQIGECEPTLDDDEVSDGRPALVELLSPSNFPDVISRSEQMLVMFYSPGESITISYLEKRDHEALLRFLAQKGYRGSNTM